MYVKSTKESLEEVFGTLVEVSDEVIVDKSNHLIAIAGYETADFARSAKRMPIDDFCARYDAVDAIGRRRHVINFDVVDDGLAEYEVI
jgi:hypothetical protein